MKYWPKDRTDFTTAFGKTVDRHFDRYGETKKRSMSFNERVEYDQSRYKYLYNAGFRDLFNPDPKVKFNKIGKAIYIMLGTFHAIWRASDWSSSVVTIGNVLPGASSFDLIFPGNQFSNMIKYPMIHTFIEIIRSHSL